MKVKQISVFLENKSGRLAKVSRTLGDRRINIRALSIADTTDFGILRLIASDPEQALSALKEEGFTVSATEVIAVQVPDRPGGLADILGILEGAGINIEYMYAFVGKTLDDAVVVFRVEEIDRAIALLGEKGVTLLRGDQVYRF
ncbi:MAG: ACT domain-containing protein [Patescibacteria group bacterium]